MVMDSAELEAARKNRERVQKKEAVEAYLEIENIVQHTTTAKLPPDLVGEIPGLSYLEWREVVPLLDLTPLEADEVE